MGTVFDPSGMGVAGADITVRNLKSHHTWHGATDAIGEFTALVPPGPGDYVIRANAPGDVPAQAQVHVYATEHVTIFLHVTPKKR